MRGLSLWQPWATLIATGDKRVETRHWSTAYRGPVAIHAAKRFQHAERNLCRIAPFAEALKRGGYEPVTHARAIFDHPGDGLPLGAFVALADLEIVTRTESVWAASQQGRHIQQRGISYPMTDAEWEFGDYRAGRYAWFFRAIRPLSRPLPYKGMQGLFGLPFAVQQEITDAAGHPLPARSIRAPDLPTPPSTRPPDTRDPADTASLAREHR